MQELPVQELPVLPEPQPLVLPEPVPLEAQSPVLQEPEAQPLGQGPLGQWPVLALGRIRSS